MITRDKFDKAIEEKLHNYSQEPPRDMWAAIEADLTKVAVVHDRAKKILLRRNFMQLAVAASLMIVLVSTALLYNREEIVITDLIEEIAEFKPAVEQNLEQTAQITPLVAAHSKQHLAAHVTPTKSVSQSVKQPKNIEPMESQPNHTTASTAEITAATKDSSAPEEKQERKEKVVVKDPRPNTPMWYNNIEAPTPKKRVRKATSLYAANIGITGSDANIPSKSSYSMSKFMIQEYSMTAGMANPISNDYKPESLRHHAPLSFGLSFSWGIAKRFDIETGLTYTFLKSDAETESKLFSYKQQQKLHYIGIPVSVKYNIIDHKRWGVYAKAGAMIEKSIYGEFSTKVSQNSHNSSGSSETNTDSKEKMDISGVQGSLSVGAGAEYKFSKMLGIYLEPSMNYYINSDRQPLSYLTENPLHFGLKAGFRINFN